MADEDALVSAQFQVPASEVEAGVNGRLLLKATLHAASSEAIKQTEETKTVVEQAKEEVNQVQEDFTSEVAARLGYKLTVNNVSATDYTLAESDEGSLVRMTSDSENTVTVPAHADVEFEQGTVINIRQAGLGRTYIEGAEGVTLNAPGESPYSTDGSEFGIAVVKVADNEWDFVKAFEGVPLPEVNDFVDEVEGYFDTLDKRMEETRRTVEDLNNSLRIIRDELGSEDAKLKEELNSVESKTGDLQADLSSLQDDLDVKPGEDAFENDLFEDGYQKLPGGLIIQWAKAHVKDANRNVEVKVTLPIKFPNANLHPMLSDTRGDIYDDDQGAQVEAYDRESVTIKSYWNRTMGGFTAYILAIGY